MARMVRNCRQSVEMMQLVGQTVIFANVRTKSSSLNRVDHYCDRSGLVETLSCTYRCVGQRRCGSIFYIHVFHCHHRCEYRANVLANLFPEVLMSSVNNERTPQQGQWSRSH